MNELEKWAMEDVATSEFDAAIEAMLEAEKDYKEKKAISTDAYNEHAARKAHVLELLQKTGKTKYHAEGLGLVSMKKTASIKVPKDFEQKKLFLQHFRGLGDEAYINTVTINSRTLNSYYNEQLEQDSSFTIEGIEGVTESVGLTVRKEKK